MNPIKNFSLLEGIAVSAAGFSAVRSFNTVIDKDLGTASTLFKGQRDDTVEKSNDIILILTTTIPAGLMLMQAAGDKQSFEREEAAETRLKNSNDFITWLIIAALAFSSYRFQTKYHDTIGCACSAIAAALYFANSISTVPSAE